MTANFEITLTINEYNTLQGLREYYLHNEIINSTFENFGEFINFILYPAYCKDSISVGVKVKG